MTSPNVRTLLSYADLQMAAEAIDLNRVLAGELALEAALTRGNDRSSRFTPTQAAQFVEAGWSVLDHRANTSTGFSGTLFKNTLTGELVLSFRSTEFIDDAARDNQATNTLEIKEAGFAIGQISDMESWFRELNADPGKLQGRNFAVTGYSLGGHLATAFNLLHGHEAGRITATYTFNGAGVGRFPPNASLRTILERFDSQRQDARSVFADQAVQAEFIRLRSVFDGQTIPTSVDLEALVARFPNALFRGTEANVLYVALDRIRTVLFEAARVPSLTSGGEGASPRSVTFEQIAGGDLDYQVAVLESQRTTQAIGVLAGGIQALTVRQQGAYQIDNMFDVYGAASPSAVANSQLHYGAATPVFIENQPLWRGSVVVDAVAASWTYEDVKLLVEHFERNDFGDTHSLVLLVDSLRVQEALTQLDPTASVQTLDAVLRAASHATKQEGGGANNQGKAEGDVLERVLDSLARMMIDPAASSMAADMSGGTWADPSARAVFHQRLEAVVSSAAFQAIKGRVTLTATDASALRNAAKGDFGAFLALHGLSSLTFKALPGQTAAVEGALGAGSMSAMYADWSADKALTQQQRGQDLASFSDQFYADRSTLLAALLKRNLDNAPGPVYTGAQLGLTVAEQTVFTDLASETQLVVGGTSMPSDPSIRKQVWFGSDLANAFDGSGRDDRLYGGGGNDSVTGQAGTDWVEGGGGDDSLEGGGGSDTVLGGAGADILIGGADNDSLLGGAGLDTYRFSGVWHTDVIRDSGDDGAIVVEGLGTLSGTDAKLIAANVWQTDDKRVTFSYVAADDGQKSYLLINIAADATGTHRGNIRVDDWSQGRLGIRLGSEVAPAPVSNQYWGDFAKQNNGEIYGFVANGGYTDFKRYANAGAQTGAQDVLNGATDGSADLLYGLEGNDGLAGGAGDDTLEGGAGDDLLKGGTGADSLIGGAGNDVILGSALGDVATPFTLGAERDPVPVGFEAFTQGFSWTALRQPGPRIDGNTLNFKIAGVYGAFTGDAWRVGEQWYIETTGNVIDGGAGDDFIAAGTAADIVHGGADDDDIFGQEDSDVLFGDAGADAIVGDGFDSASPTAFNASGLWYLPGSEGHGADVIDGGAGNDWLWGTGGGDEIYGGTDYDLLLGDGLLTQVAAEWHGSDYLDGGAGADGIAGHGIDDTLFGGAGNDALWGDNGRAETDLPSDYYGQDYLDGEDGEDYLQGGGSDDMLIGGLGADTLFGDGQNELLEPFSAHGDDTLEGGDGADALLGGGGSDMLDGGGGNDVLHGDDLLAFVVASVHGDDFLDGGIGNDALYGDGGNDYLAGGDGNDWLAGEDHTTLDATSTLQGADTLFGGGGSDVLVGGNGNDVLDGGAGVDYLAGGAGVDTYLLQAGDLPVIDGLSEVINDSSLGNVVRFGSGVDLGGVQIANTVNANDLALTFAATNSVVISNGLGGAVGRFEFADGTGLTHSELVGRVAQGIVALTDTNGIYTVMGGNTNDSATAHGGSTVFSGGRGDDAFTASGGNNTYRFSSGDGHDTIADLRNIDSITGQPVAAGRIIFGTRIAAEDISLTVDNGGLTLNVGTGSGDSIRLTQFDAQNALDPLPSIATFVFDDGMALTLEELLARGFDFAGGAGDETIVGTNLSDRFAATTGNDVLRGGEGADVYRLATDSGQDVVDDSAAAASGDDTLRLGAGLTAANTTFLRSGNDLVARDATGANRVLVLSHYAGAGIERVEFDGGAIWTRADIDAHLTNELSDAADVFTGTPGADTILARGGNDSIGGAGGDDTIDGGAGNDTLRGGDGNDSLSGGAGLDLLYGDAGSDMFDGRGDGERDFMAGAFGADTYLFGRGSGADEIYDLGDAGTVDVVRLDNGITPSEVRVTSPNGFDFTLTIAGSNDSLRLISAASAAANRIERVEFGDGTAWDDAALRAQYFAGVATSGNDQILGWHESDDDIDGGAGVDTLYGLGGNDTLRNGEVLFGGAGSDSYVFSSWSNATIEETAQATPHTDAIVLAGSVSPNALVSLKENSDHLSLWMPGSSNRVTVTNFFATLSGGQQVEEVRFANGTVWTAADLFAQRVAVTGGDDTAVYGFGWSDTLDGLSGNDALWGRGGNDSVVGGTGNDSLYGDSALSAAAGDGNDTLDGSAGNDKLFGGGGNDTYRFGRGGGTDAVTEAAGTDRVLLGAGVLTADVSLFRLGSDLVLAIDQGPTQLTITGHFSGAAAQIESIEFADGSAWDAAAIVARTVTGIANVMTGTAGNDVFIVDNESDTISEGLNQGTDTVQSSVHFTLGANLENLTLTGFLSTNGNGNTLNNVLSGNAGNNVLFGGAGADTVDGAAGDDWLYANAVDRDLDAAVDVLRGGAGDDIYVVTATFDVPDQTVEFAGEGRDTVRLNLYASTYTLQANIEELVVQDYYGAGLTLTGNALDNVITGPQGQGGTVIDGGLGADTMIGSALLGANYYVDNLGDKTVGPAGNVFSSVDWTLGNGFSNLTLIGSAAISGTGNAANNTLNSRENFAANTLIGGLGNDTYIVSENDTVVEAADGGIDTVFINVFAGAYTLGDNIDNVTLQTASSVALTGNALSNVLVGSGYSANDTLLGNGGNDLLYDHHQNDAPSSVDRDLLQGGDGDDTLIAYRGQDTLDGGAGNDSLTIGASWLTPNDIFTPTALFGFGDGHDQLTSYQSNASIALDAGVRPSDLTLSRNGTGLTVTLAGGADSITITNFFADAVSTALAGKLSQVEFANGMRLIASQLVSRLQSANANVATAGADFMIGTAGSDTLNGLAGNDVLWGEGGDDFYVVADNGGADRIEDSGGAADRLSLGAGTTASHVTVSRQGQDLFIAASDGTTVNVARFFDGVQWQLESVQLGDGTQWNTAALLQLAQTIRGTSGNDVLNGDALANVLIGLGGNDTLSGNDGDDRLDGGTGNDSLVGGAGIDTMLGGDGDDRYAVDGAADVVTELVGEGYDTIDAGVSFVLPDNVEAVTADGTTLGIALTGNSANNSLTGNAAANTLDGGAGADALAGGAGNDTYVVDDAGDVVTEASGAGTDTVLASVSFALGTNVEDLTLTGVAAINAIGNTVANTLIGNSAANTLTGGAGNDTMRGGAGGDTYVVDATGDSLTENTNEGIDTVQSSVTWALGNEFENLTLTANNAINGTGNGLANVLTGNSAANTLSGGLGDDVYVFAAGSGTDTLVETGGATDRVELGSVFTPVGTTLARTGNDILLSFAGRTESLRISNWFVAAANQIESIVFTDGTVWSAAYVSANARSVINGTAAAETLNGSAADDQINGLAGNDTINGNGGNDILDGGAGNDSMRGGAGNDTYLVDSISDSVTENAGEGRDLVQSGVAWTLGLNVDDLTLTGSGNFNAIGNADANVITGNAGNNAINGAAGADTLIGGGGNDSYTVDNIGDVITELPGEGADLVQSSVSITTLAPNVENLTLTGSSGLSATGNVLDNVLTGNSGANALNGGAGNDRIDGGSGNDTMAGGAGNDTYVADVSTDVITEQAGEGTDTIESSVTLSLATRNNVENLTLLGTSALGATGNALDNVLTGNSGANSLTGGDGSDRLDGGAGNDTMTGGLGDDTYVINVSTDVISETAGQGTDTVESSITFTLSNANLENLKLIGTGVINGTGNASANLLIGNGGVNTLTGLEGNDTYDGAAGSDNLTDSSASSNDVYRWGVGQGNDRIADAGGSDRIEIGAGVVASQVSLVRNGSNLEVRISGATDLLTVVNWYSSTANRIEEIRLADGTVINAGTAAPLSVSGPTELSQMRRGGGQVVAGASAVDSARIVGSRDWMLLIQAMAQFDGRIALSDSVERVRRPDHLRIDLAAPL